VVATPLQVNVSETGGAAPAEGAATARATPVTVISPAVRRIALLS
jgi:hypothetical protein